MDTESSSRLAPQQLIMVIVLLAGASLAVLNQTTVSPMLPIIMTDFGINASLAQWLVSGYALVSAVIIPVSAYLMQRFTTRAVYFSSMALFLLGTLLCTMAPNFPVLLLGRGLQAACAGVLMPLATSIMLLVFPPERRGFAMGLYSLILCLMPAVGPGVAGGLTDSIGWRAFYVVMLAIAGIITVFAIINLRNYGEARRSHLDILSVILSGAGLVSLLYGISDLGNSGFSILALALILGGAAVFGLFVYRQLKLKVPVLDMSVFKYRRYTIGLVITKIVQMTVCAVGVSLPILMQTGLGLSATATGMLFLLPSVLGAGTSLLAGKLFDRFGPRMLSILGAVLLAISFAGMSFVTTQNGFLWLMLWLSIENIANMLVITPINSWALAYLPDELIPHGNAMNSTLTQVANSMGTAVFIAILASATLAAPAAIESDATIFGSSVTFIVQAAFCVIVLVGIIAFVRTGQLAEFEQAEPKDPKMLTAKDIMRINAPILTDEDTIRAAVKKFHDAHTTDAPVVDGEGRVVAYLSSADIMRQLIHAQIVKPDLTGWVVERDNESFYEKLNRIIDSNVMSIATKKVVSVSINDSVEHVCKLLSLRQFKKVPVVDNGRIAGTINRDDVIDHILGALAI